MTKKRVVITGIGIIASPGATTDSFWNACCENTGPIAAIPEHWTDYAPLHSTIWAPLPEFDDSLYGISRLDRMQMARSTILALCAVRQALDNAGFHLQCHNEKKQLYSLTNIDADRIGVISGTGVGGLTTLIANQANHCFTPLQTLLNTLDRTEHTTSTLDTCGRLMRMPMRFNPMVVSMMMPNAASAAIGIRFGCRGPNTTVTCACAAGTVAIGQAFQTIRQGNLDCVLAGGTEYLRDDFGGIFRGFDVAKTLVTDYDDPHKANRPFDSKRTGFLFSEGGAAFLVLEEYNHALRRGAEPIAEIIGCAQTFDAHSIMSLDPKAPQIQRMLNLVFTDAGISPHEIDYVNTHGTGTLVNDEVEARLIQTMFPHQPLVTSTKSLTGHTIGAAGAIETAVCALSIQRKFSHACKNLSDPVLPLNFITKSGPFPITTALTQSFAFGGHNAALVLREVHKG